MSQQDLWAVVGRARTDSEFVGQLMKDFPSALRQNGYSLDANEITEAQNAIQQASAPAPNNAALPGPTQINQEVLYHMEEMRKRNAAQLDRLIDLGKFTVQILKDTLNNAKNTYQAITRMNLVMFCMGVGLFIFAAVEGAINHNLAYTAAFAGLGAASFVALFFLGPIDKTQAALSNLIQAEVAFMTYFEQLTFCENYALTPAENTGRPDTGRLERASELLQKRSLETVEMLQKYLEFPVKDNADKTAKTPSSKVAKTASAG